MGFAFKKLNTGDIVASNGNMVFRKLSTIAPITPPPEIKEGFDIRWLGLAPGMYIITATACADGYLESEHSNSVTVRL